jgi:hypothetical protein
VTPTRRRVGIAIGLAAVALAVIAGPAAACSGTRLGDAPIDDSGVDLHFTGTAIRVEDLMPLLPADAQHEVWTFAVDGVQKGELGEQVTITTPATDGMCGIDFRLGRRYEVLASGSDWFGHATALLTDGSGPVEPIQAAPPIVGRVPSGGIPIAGVALAAVVGTALVAFAVTRRRRPLRARSA